MWRLVTLCSLFLVAGCIADLRPPELDQMPDVDARGLLEETCRKHGLTVWQEHRTYTVTFRDRFQGLKGWYANSFGENPVELQCAYAVGRFEGEVEFLSGKKKGEIWGFMNDQPYRLLPGGAHMTNENKHIRFWVPTIQYFVEFPLRILEADTIAYAGEATYDGRVYDRIIASWRTLEPQKEIDQYLIWISRESGLIEMIQYSVRDYFKWYRGTAIFEDFENHAGVLIPTSVPVFAKHPDKSKVHHMGFENFRFLDSDDLPEPAQDSAAVAPPNTDPAEAFVEVARVAVDRNCGSCHHSNRSSNHEALAIFDLAKPCWYCTIHAEQTTGLQNRTQGSDQFTVEEQEAIREVIARIR
ncbi:MAG: hypothetical protein R3330_01230 [Saprospiraceae bacterium]|nr:hypothetical protein [Saprospiraceae bacterium]